MELENHYVYKVYVPFELPGTLRSKFKNFFDSFTVYNALGYWKNEVESIYVYEVVAPWHREQAIINFCNFVKKELKQEAILYTKQPIEANLI